MTRKTLNGAWETGTFKGHTEWVSSISLSLDGRYVLSGSFDKTVKLWEIATGECIKTFDWDVGAREYLRIFLTQQTPYAVSLPTDRSPTDEEITLALTRRGRPVWSEEDFQSLLYTLGCVGFGWLRPEGVRRKLEKMAAAWDESAPA